MPEGFTHEEYVLNDKFCPLDPEKTCVESNIFDITLIRMNSKNR
jgi:hypothetical protein